MSDTPLHTADSVVEIATRPGMLLFADLVKTIGTNTKTNAKVKAIIQYFMHAEDKDKVWVLALFSGRRPKRAVTTKQLTEWCIETANIPAWLFSECYHSVGDLAETISLLLPFSPSPNPATPALSLHFYIEKFLELRDYGEEEKKHFILDSWKHMDRDQLFVFNKLITGSFRIGVSQSTIVNALSKLTGTDSSVVAHRISGGWDPSTTTFKDLLEIDADYVDPSKPYPFYLAYALDADINTLGDINQWQTEWKWDGIRGQIIKRDDELFVWSRGEELMTEKFPEYQILKDLLPNGIALDGEIIPAIDGKPLPFALMQTRIGRKNITKKHLQEAPICFFVYDLLEFANEDWRGKPLHERRQKLEEIISPIQSGVISLSEIVKVADWQTLVELRKQSREMGAEGFMLKRKDSIYQVGRKTGDWWKWKIEPLVIDCVMIYAQKGAGRRSGLYTAYTFAVRDGDALVPFTRAYSGLTDKEIREVDAFVKRNAIEKFGPVRTVKPELVFEIAFEGIAESKRHKSGVALRFPRINRWRKDKSIQDINTLDDLKKMLAQYGQKSS